MLRGARTKTKTASKKTKKKTNKKFIYHINCGIIEGFPALRKAVTTHVNKITVTFYFYANQLLTRESWSG